MSKIGILTFHGSHNYGSMLQAYALQKCLKSSGHQVMIINLRNKNNKILYAFPFDIKKRGKRLVLLSCKHIFRTYKECKTWFLFEHFLSEFYHLTDKTYESWQEIKNDLANLNFDAIITGGDQIWNMRCYDFDISYFLPEKLNGIKKISYCPSMGGKFLSIINEKEKEFIISCLRDYNCISVREEMMKTFLTPFLKSDIKVVVDPTMLLKKEDYLSLIKEKPLIKEKYVFYYSPWKNEEAEEIALHIGGKMGLKVVCSQNLDCKGLRHFITAGPCEFLNLFKHAEYVIGKSFHLIVFSLLFHKQFLAINGIDDFRMRNILEKYGLEQRGKATIGNCLQIINNRIEFAKVDFIMEQERKESISFLHNLLTT